MSVKESPNLSPEKEMQQLNERINFLKVQVEKKPENNVNQQESASGNVANFIHESSDIVKHTTSSLGKRSGSQGFTEVETKRSKLSIQPQHSGAGPSTSQDTKRVNCQRYEKLGGVIDNGKEYEIIMCALYALKFTISDQVCGFEMTSNNAKCGAFDDIELKVTFEKNETCCFLLQLKYKKNSEPITRDILMGQKDFYLPHYLESISFLKKHNKTQYFILYTNRPMNVPKNEWLSYQYHEALQLQQGSGTRHNDLILNSEQPSCIYQFVADINRSRNIDLKDSCQRFYLFTSQKKVEVVKSEIQNILGQLVQCDIYNAFEHFMKMWWSGNFILTKQDVVAKLTELTLSPYIRTLTARCYNEKAGYLAQVIMDFDLTIIDNCDNTIEDIWAASEGNCLGMVDIVEKFGLSQMEKSKILWHLGLVPFIIDVKETNRRCVYNVMKLLKKSGPGRKIILIGRAQNTEFKNWKIFETCADLKNHPLFDKMCTEFKISLQGRGSVSLQQLIGVDEEIAHTIKITDLLKMAQNDHLTIGKRESALPEIYIPRKVVPFFVDVDAICNQNFVKQCTVVLNCDETFAQRLESKQVKVIELSQYLLEDSQNHGSFIIVSKTAKCTNNQFRQICMKSTKSDIYLFQVFNKDCCILLLKSKAAPIPQHLLLKQKTIEESNVLECLDNPLNTFCAPPGIGKTVLLQAMSSIYCPSDNWSIHVNLISLNPFLRKNPSPETFLSHILGTDPLAKIFYRRKKVIIFLDGLDEVDSASLDLLLSFIRHISSEGVRVWLTSRDNLRDKLVHELDTIPTEIEKFDQNQQREYMHMRLKDSYGEEERAKIVNTIFSSTDVANSQELLGIPLQLYLITEIFIDNPDLYDNLSNENIFVLTKMYAKYFEGKKKFMLTKTGVQEQEKQLGAVFKTIIKQYAVLGLKTALDDTDFKKLAIDMFANEDLILEIRAEGDKLGIIKDITTDEQIIFTHQTYAEYLACVWLKAHTKEVHLLRKEMFSERYENLKLMFDIMVAEKNPLHLAIIYKNMELFGKYIDDADKIDESGRNALHLACSYGTKYSKRTGFNWNDIRNESQDYVKAVDILLNRDVSIWDKDTLFRFDCLEFALMSRCLYPVEKMLEKGRLEPKNLEQVLYSHFDEEPLAFYATYLKYPNLLSTVLVQKPIDVNNEKLCKFGLLRIAVMGNKNLAKTDNHWCDVIKLLLNHGARCLNGYNILHVIAICGTFNQDMLQLAKELEIDVNSQNASGETPLHFAFDYGSAEDVKSLLERGANVNVLNTKEQSILHYGQHSMATNRGEKIDLLIQYGLDVNGRYQNGQVPLQIVCERGSLENANKLLEKGANVEILDDEGENALHRAVRSLYKKEYIIDLLLSCGLDINARNKHGQAPLHIACDYGALKNVQKLVDRGADVNVVDNEGKTALHYIVQSELEKTQKMIDLLTNRGLQVNIRSKSGQTALFVACELGLLKNVKKLLEKGADVKILDNDGKSLLHYPGRLETEEMINLLIQQGLEVDARSESGQTPLHIACHFGAWETVKNLVSKGASVNMLDNEGKSVLHYVTESFCDKDEIIGFLINHGIDVNAYTKGQTPLHIVCQFGSVENVKTLLEKGANVNTLDFDQKSALHYVDESEFEERKGKIDLIITHGLDVNSRFKNDATPLHIVCKSGSIDNVRCLLAQGAKSNTTIINRNLLHYAAASEDIEVIKHILTLETDVNAHDNNGTTPLHIACRYGNYENVKQLIDAGASISAVDYKGKTTLHYTADSKNPDQETVQYLVDSTDPKSEDLEGRNALAYAMKVESVKAVKILLETTQFLEFFDPKDAKFLFWSVYSGSVYGVELLVEERSNLDEIETNDEHFSLYFATVDGVLQMNLLMQMTKFISKLIASRYRYYTRLGIVEYLKYLSSLPYYKITTIFETADDDEDMENRWFDFVDFMNEQMVEIKSNIRKSENDW